MDHYWNRVNPQHKGSCHDPSFMAISTYAQSAINLVTDCAYAGLPILILRKLQVSRYKRVSLSIMLGLGAVTSVAVIVRIPYVFHLATTEDFLWQTTDVAIWSYIEPGLGLTILNLVVTRPLFQSVFSRFGDITSVTISRNRGYSSKVSAYAKPFTYGASTAMASAGGSAMFPEQNCGCSYDQPCTCEKNVTFYGDSTPLDIEQGFALGTITSPKTAHLDPDQKGIRLTTEISASSMPRVQAMLPGTRAAREARVPPSRGGDSTAEYGDKEVLVKPPGRRQNYGRSVMGRAA